MQLDAILEVAIGLVFVWLVISVATLEVQNRVSSWLNWRADHLEQSILSMLKDKALVAKFYEHPLILEFMSKDKDGKLIKDKKGRNKLPDYIPSYTFAAAACEIMMNAGRDEDKVASGTLSIEEMKASAQALMEKNPNLGSINQYLLPKMDKAANDVDAMLTGYRHNVENWFNDVMGHTSQQYKLHAQKWALIIGFFVAIFINIDTIQVAQKLWQEPTTRAVLVAQAEAQVQQDSTTSIDTKNVNFPIGWTTTALETSNCSGVDIINAQLIIRSAGECRAVTGLPAFNNIWGWIVKITGYILSAFAAAQGAPFWFDILKKLVGIKQQPAPAK